MVGIDDGAAEEAVRAVAAGARVVVALGGATMAEFSRLASRKLLRLEAERRLTILWNAAPAGVEDLGGFPMVDFADRSIPTLQFDHVVYRIPPTTLVHSPGEVEPATTVFAIGPAPIEGEAVHLSPAGVGRHPQPAVPRPPRAGAPCAAGGERRGGRCPAHPALQRHHHPFRPHPLATSG